MNNVPALANLRRALDERGAPGERLLEAVAASGTTSVYLTASGVTRRTDLLMPFERDALRIIDANASVLEIPNRAMLHVSASDDRLDTAMVVVGPVPAETAIDHAGPATGRDAWRPIVDAMVAGGGRLTSRTRYLMAPLGEITVRYDDRGPAEDQAFRAMVDALCKRVDIPSDQRALWPELHAVHGSGAGVTITTSCGPNGPKPELRFLYRTSQWDVAVSLAKLVAPSSAVRTAAMALGALAGSLGVEELSGIELVLGANGPDVLIWAVIPTEGAPNAFEENLSHPGPLLAAFDYDEVGDVYLFHVRDGRLVLLADTKISPEGREPLIEQMLARRVRIGGTYTMRGFTWVADEAGMTVWHQNVAVASRDKPPVDAANVTLFFDHRDLGRRGVRFTLNGGNTELLAEEDDPMYRLDPTYDRCDLDNDSQWAFYLAEHLAVWSALPVVDEVSGEPNELLTVFAPATRAASEQLQQRAGEVTVSIGSFKRAAGLTLHVPASRQELELRIDLADGSSTGVTLKRGTPQQIAAYLHRVTTPRDIRFAMNRAIDARTAK